MNRITRLLHKARFLSRQRHILSYSHKYVIDSNDLIREEEAPSVVSRKDRFGTDHAKIVADLVEDFDADKNETDRRIFFEVTGIQLVEGEFYDLDTSDEEWAIHGAPNPLANLFSKNGYG